MNTKKSLKQQFCARCGKQFSRYKLQSYCSHSCSSKARGERGNKGMHKHQLDERWLCVYDPEPCQGNGFRGFERALEGWLHERDGLVLQNWRGDQITTPRYTERTKATVHNDPKPETASLDFGQRRSMRLLATKVG